MSDKSQVVSGNSPASASTAVLGQFSGLAAFKAGVFIATLTGATGGALDVYLQVYDRAADKWFDYAHFPQKAEGSAVTTVAIPVSREYQRVASRAIGSDATPALAVDTCVGGDFGDVVRVLCVAGVGTSAGAAQTVRFRATQP